MAQLPSGAAGAAAGAMVYSCISEICSFLMLWLTWSHGEQFTYVACVAYFTLLSTTASIIQQVHDIITWRDMLWDQFNNKKLNPNNAEQAIANGSVGMDLVLYYIQYYCYSVEAMFVMFWAIALAQSVYRLNERGKLRRMLNKINAAGKIIAVVFPLCTILSLRIPALQKQLVPFILVADLPLMLSLAVGSSTMLVILTRYVQSRRKLTSFNVSYGTSSQSGSRSADTTVNSSMNKSQPTRSVYDRWLMGRFTIAFFALSIFEVTNTLFQLASINNIKKDAALTEPDFSLERARTTFALFLPGVTPGIFLFIIFGTTRNCRTLMLETFTLRRWRRLREEKRNTMGACAAGRRDLRKPLPSLPKAHWADEAQGESIQMRAPRSENASESNLSDGGSILPIMKPDMKHHPREGHKSPWRSPAL
ncbi:uncharacterized protein GLRG_06266 [Colletotrichum graminicola M1.001]|uniref:Glycoside hydrolase n=1 Tax=Colletotrichum graminicola (strain M1.001 / M2 / FGSC 10212) TaxID=645133 RepID=E3QJT4_COLGM|nr:uncharacterized protein GLRG_06266 [Colletotrichum graminicola M1.001]EFQ31122.1 hypothetical protein GLRG_06266 [Colletotrichum graminicola M1.001]